MSLLLGSDEMILASIGVSLFTKMCMFFWSKARKSRYLEQCRRKAGHVSAMILPEGSGKTTLCTELTANNSEHVLIVDLHRVMEVQYGTEMAKYSSLNANEKTVELYPKVRTYIEGLKQNFKGWRILLVTSDYKAVQYACVYDIKVYLPRERVLNAIASIVEKTADKGGPKRAQEIRHSYIELCRLCKGNEIVWSSWEDLGQKVRKHYSLTVGL